MIENFYSNCGNNSVYRPVQQVNIGGMNNKTYIYSTVNYLEVSGMNQVVYANYQTAELIIFQ